MLLYTTLNAQKSNSKVLVAKNFVPRQKRYLKKTLFYLQTYWTEIVILSQCLDMQCQHSWVKVWYVASHQKTYLISQFSKVTKALQFQRIQFELWIRDHDMKLVLLPIFNLALKSYFGHCLQRPWSCQQFWYQIFYGLTYFSLLTPQC